MSWGRWLLTVLVFGVAVGAAAPAYAHNSLTASDPEDGETVEEAPDRIRLGFLAALDPDNATLAVTGPDGQSVVDGDPEFDGDTVRVPVRVELAGEYEVAYEVLSSDGDWVNGTVEFTVAAGAVPSPTPPATTAAPSSPPPSAVPVVASAAEDSGRGALVGWGIGLVALALAGAGYLGYRRRASR